jgi:hypothetical protein
MQIRINRRMERERVVGDFFFEEYQHQVTQAGFQA